MVKIACVQPEVFQETNKCYLAIEEILKDFFSKYDSCDIICLPERWVPLMNEKKINLQKERGEDYKGSWDEANKKGYFRSYFK